MTTADGPEEFAASAKWLLQESSDGECNNALDTHSIQVELGHRQNRCRAGQEDQPNDIHNCLFTHCKRLDESIHTSV